LLQNAVTGRSEKPPPFRSEKSRRTRDAFCTDDDVVGLRLLLIATNGRNGNCTDGEGGGGVMNRPSAARPQFWPIRKNFLLYHFCFVLVFLSLTVQFARVAWVTPLAFFVAVRRDLFSASFDFLPLFVHKFSVLFCCRHVHLRETVGQNGLSSHRNRHDNAARAAKNLLLNAFVF
jgi:hypothetical protein